MLIYVKEYLFFSQPKPSDQESRRIMITSFFILLYKTSLYHRIVDMKLLR